MIAMLKTLQVKYYKVKAGQNLEGIAETFSVSSRLLAKINGLTAEPYVGQILEIPRERGNVYVVRAGDTKELLCGSVERFERLNGTDAFYIGMKVII